MQPNLDVEFWFDAVEQRAKACVFPPVHHFVQELDVVVDRSQAKGQFVADSVPDLAEHTADVNPEHFQVGQPSVAEALPGLVDGVTRGKEGLGIEGRVLLRKLTVEAQRRGQ